MSLTNCLRKAGDALGSSDRAAILARSKELRAEGKGATEAARLAVDERIAEVQALIAGWKPGAEKAADVFKNPPEIDTSAEPAKAPAKIEDFGEKLEGARKDFATKMREAQAMDVAAEPLSKTWPEPNYAKLLEGGATPYAVAFAHASRDMIPTKPKQAWKLGRWVEQVKLLRDLAAKVIDGDISEAEVRKAMDSDSLSRVRNDIGGVVDLYQRMGHDMPLKGIRVSVGEYSMFKGQTYSPAKVVWSVERQAKSGAFGNWPSQIVTADTREKVIQAFIDKVKGDADALAQRKGTQFDIWRDNGRFVVGKKIGREYIALRRFDSAKDARAFKADNQADLEAMLERYKTTPFERRTENAPRVGDDHRGGAKVLPDAFADAFKFRGIQFGNYVEQSKRQQDLNDAYDGLMDLAAVVGVPARALSLNGQLGLAFGARGHGGVHAAAAHFEPGRVVINLTKNSGAGSLAHEWFHGVDNYFARMGDGPAGYMTDGAKNPAVRPEMVAAFNGVMSAIRASGMIKRARELDKRRSKAYWATDLELAARAFEAYVIAKLQDQNASNDYLANVVSPEMWKASEALSGHEEETYPYPTTTEMPAIREAFDKFIDTLQTREGDDGNVAMFSRAAPYVPTATDESGSPTFDNAEAGITLAAPQVTERVEVIEGPGEQVLNYAIMPREGFDSYGYVELLVKDGVPVSLLDIDITPEGRRQGLGRKVIETLLAANPDADLNISNIVPTARGFWAKMGVPEQNVEGAYDGNLNWQTYAEAQDGSREGGPARASRAAGEESDPGAARTDRGPAREVAQPPAARLSPAEAAAILALPKATRDKLLGRGGVTAERVAEIARAVGAEVNVVQSVADMPEMERGKVLAQAPDGKVRGAYFKSTDATWLVLDNIHSEAEAAFVMLHEAFHRGLAKTIGPEAKRLLKAMYLTNGKLRKLAEAQMKRHKIGLDEAIEEALADLAGDGQARDLRGWAKLVDLVRGWLAKVGEAIGLDIKWTDDMVADFVAGVTREGLAGGVHVGVEPDVVASRRGWAQGFPDAVIGHKQGVAQAHPDYQAAKSGDDAAALRVARDLVTDAYVDAIRSALPAGAKPTLVPVLALEEGGKNRIPLAAATVLGQKLGLDVATDIMQAERVGRGGADGFHRLAAQPTFVGSVRGADYLILDDTLTQGGTLAQLKTHIEDNGGRVLLASALTGKAYSAKIAISHERLAELRSRFGSIEPWWRGAFGYGFEGFTESEARFLLSLRGNPTPDAIRDRVDAARVQSIGGVDGRADSIGRDRQPVDGASLSRASPLQAIREQALPMGYKVNDFITSHGKLSFWHRSIGTMHNLAQRNALFRPVYDTAQKFLNDVSYFATEAADLAPTLLPKLEGLRDLTKTPLSAEDTKAIAAPIFEGTLSWTRDDNGNVVPAKDVETAGVVWTDDELRQRFKADDKQIGLYHEFRKSVDQSLTDLAVSDMIRYAGSDADAVREAALASGNVMQAAKILTEHLATLAEAAGKDRAATLTDTGAKIIEKAERARDLMARGYAPLSRFGHYTLDVIGKDGQRIYFGLFESQAEANRFARKMQAEHPGAAVNQGTLSQEAYKLFAGVSPETLELFGGMLGLEQSGDGPAAQAFQEYIKLAKSNRSALKRLIHRKGIAGFSEDAGRVLSGFVYSNARQASKNLHFGELSKAVQKIAEDKGQGELLDTAVQLHEYITNPREEAHKVRGLLFAQFLGGSLAAGVVNLTQSVSVTFPYLSQFGGVKAAAGQMTAALRDAVKWEKGRKSTGDAKLDAALKKAEEDGIVSPQEVHHLLAQAGGGGALRAGDGTAAGDTAAKASNFMSKLMLAWGRPFAVAEQFNRRVAFIAAYRTAVEQKMADPAGFAAQAVTESQFSYTKANRPKWARGAIGATLFTFKTFSISFVELLTRMAANGPEGKRAALVGLAMLFLMSGMQGLPGADDLDDLIDGALQRLGYNFSSKQAKREFLASVLGEGGAMFALKGISGLPGVPIDVAGRLGMGNLIPGTGLLTKKEDHARDVSELLGPAGRLAEQALKAGDAVVQGEFLRAAQAAAPVAAANVLKAFDMASMGMYRDDKGRKVIDTDATDAVMKAIGFQPNDVARVQQATSQVQQMVALNKLRESEISAKWAMGVFEQDPEKVQEARQELQDWNAANPESRIAITTTQIMRRVRDMRASKDERLAKTAPKEIRAQVRRELEAIQ